MSRVRPRPLLGPAIRNLVVFVATSLACVYGTTSARAVTLNPGDVVLVDADSFGGLGGVIKVDPISGAQTKISQGGSFSHSPVALAFDSDGTIWAINRGGNPGLVRVDPISGAQTPISTGGLFVKPNGIAVEADGNVLVSDFDGFGGTGKIIRVDPATGGQTVVASGGSLVDPTGMVLDANGDILVADFGEPGGTGKIVKVNPSTGAQTVVSSGGVFIDPFGITLDLDGNILVADFDNNGGAGKLIRVDPVTGTQSIVSSGGFFVNLAGVAVEASGNILVSDANAFGGPGGIIRVDPITGVQTSVSSGGSFVTPRFLVIAPVTILNPASKRLVSGPWKEDIGLVPFDIDGDGLVDEGAVVSIAEKFAQHWTLEIVITNSLASVDLADLVFVDTIEVPFALDPVGEDYDADLLIDGFCADAKCDGFAADLNCPVSVTFPGDVEGLEEHVIVIEAGSLPQDADCTTSIFVVTTKKANKGKGKGKPNFAPSKCLTVLSSSGAPVLDTVPLNRGVRTIDATTGVLRAGPSDPIHLTPFNCP